MCRLAAFPPGTTAEEAHEITNDFVGGNDDGVGEAYVKDGSFVVNKYPYSYKEALGKKVPLYAHMPYEGWTISHVRFATHGGNEYKNTHPFIKGNIAVVHNGVFGASGIIRLAMGDSIKWQGDTDSEVAAYLLNKLGPEGFFKEMPSSAGVYLALGRDGSLTAVKLGGDLKIWRTPTDKFILASDFKYSSKYWKDDKEVVPGVLKLDKDGHAKNFNFDKKKEDSYSKTYYGSSYTTSDIGFPRGFPPRHPTSTESQPKGDSKDSVPMIGQGTHKTPTLQLWDWPSDEQINRYYLEMQA